MKPFITVAGYPYPDPSEYEANTATFVDAGRNVNGVTIGAVIREDVAKVSMKWNFVRADEWAKMLQKWSKKFGGSFYSKVEFFNQDTNNWETRTFYVNDRKASVYLRDKAGKILGYKNPSMNLIEK